MWEVFSFSRAAETAHTVQLLAKKELISKKSNFETHICDLFAYVSDSNSFSLLRFGGKERRKQIPEPRLGKSFKGEKGEGNTVI